MKLYREVKCSERLPDKNDEYSVQIKETLETPSYKWAAYFDPTSTECIEFWKDQVEWWLEPHELPTEEQPSTIYIFKNKSGGKFAALGNTVEEAKNIISKIGHNDLECIDSYVNLHWALAKP